jgi:hypothetical protein
MFLKIGSSFDEVIRADIAKEYDDMMDVTMVYSVRGPS